MDQYGHGALQVNTYCDRGQKGHTAVGINMGMGRYGVNTYCDRGQKGHTTGQCGKTALLVNMDILWEFHTLSISGT